MPQPTCERPCINCGRASLPKAPFPICLKCGAAVFAFVRSGVRLVTPEVVGFEPETDPPLPRPHVVYYVALAGLIKIGTTGDLKERLHALPPIAQLLGVERGGYDVERERHQQFADLRVRPLNGGQTEWFRDVPSLRAHIAKLPKPTAA